MWSDIRVFVTPFVDGSLPKELPNGLSIKIIACPLFACTGTLGNHEYYCSPIVMRSNLGQNTAMQASLIIPALNEEDSLLSVLAAIPPGVVKEVIVVDGGSDDRTVEIAEGWRARVIVEKRRGYGLACARGVAEANGEVVIFLDADGADDPAKIPDLLAPLEAGRADMALGSRLGGEMTPGAMPWHQHFGNWLATKMISVRFQQPLTDLSPFRAVNRERLLALDMQEMTYGWPTEMIVKALRAGWKVVEIPVPYRPRLGGRSKISGTLRGTLLATYFILTTIMRHGRA